MPASCRASASQFNAEAGRTSNVLEEKPTTMTVMIMMAIFSMENIELR